MPIIYKHCDNLANCKKLIRTFFTSLFGVVRYPTMMLKKMFEKGLCVCFFFIFHIISSGFNLETFWWLLAVLYVSFIASLYGINCRKYNVAIENDAKP